MPYMYEDYLKQLLSMEIAYNNNIILRRIWHLPRQCHTRIILDSFCRWKLHITIYCEGRRIWHLPMQCHTRILHLTAGLHSLVNRTISLTEVHFTEEILLYTDSVLIKHLLSRYSIVPQLAIICVIAGLLRPCLENRFHLFIYHKTLLPPFLIYYHTNSRTTRHTMQRYHHHHIQSTYTTHFHLKRAGTSIKNIENEKNK